MSELTERADMKLLVTMYQDIKTELRETRVRIESVLSLAAAHSAQIAALDKRDGEHEDAHRRHRGEHKAFMVKILLALLGSIPAVVAAAWWLARKLP